MSIVNQSSQTHTCFVHGDFHYANLLWKDGHISGILDFELAGIGDRDFDIAWALILRPGQKFMRTEEELREFIAGYTAVGVTAPFYLSQQLFPYFNEGAAIVNISSSRDRMSQPQTESYTAAKGGISALTHAMAVSFAGKVRVNSISPGWIDTAFTEYTGADAVQQPAGRVGNPLDIANMVLYLCSEKAGFITGENICIDGGMTRQMIYHNDFGWKLEM